MSRENLRSMPPVLWGMIGLFVAVPFWSLSFLELPHSPAAAVASFHTVLGILTYWILPLALVVAVVRRSFLFIPLFVAAAMGLVAHALTGTATVSSKTQIIHIAVIGVSALVTLLLGSKDLLLPFTTRRSRFWRRSPRVFQNAGLELTDADGTKISVQMEDYSLTGMALAGRTDEAKAFARTNRDRPVMVAARGRKRSDAEPRIPVEARISWEASEQEHYRFGVRVTDPLRMLQFIGDNLEPEARAQGISRVEALWAKSAVRRTVLTIWGFSLAGAFGMPACGTDHDNKRSRPAAHSGLSDSDSGGSTAGSLNKQPSTSSLHLAGLLLPNIPSVPSVPGWVGDAAKALGDHQPGLAGDLGKGAKSALGGWGKLGDGVDDFNRGVNGYNQCIKKGGGLNACRGVGIWCISFRAAAGVSPFTALWAPPFDNLCNDKPTLKCCSNKNPRTWWGETLDHMPGGPISGGGCWTAYNQESPINCEGNIHYGLGTHTAGLCLPIQKGNPIACTCQHIAECKIPHTYSPPESTSDDELLEPEPAGAKREKFIDDLTEKIAEKMETAANAKADRLADFVSYRGCRDQESLVARDDLTAFREGGPDLPALFQEKVALQKSLVMRATFRIIDSIPNGQARYDYVEGRLWTDTAIETYLAGRPDPTSVVLEWMSPLAFEILKEAYPAWPLLTVPLPGEALQADANFYDGCTIGLPTGSRLSAEPGTGSVRLNVEMVPDANDATQQTRVNLQIQWGDGMVDRLTQSSLSAQYQHAYPNPGTYLVRVWSSNYAGLKSLATLVVESTTGGATPGTSYLGVTNVGLKLAAEGINVKPGGISIDVVAQHIDFRRSFLGSRSVYIPPKRNSSGDLERDGVSRVEMGTVDFSLEKQVRMTGLVIRPFRYDTYYSDFANLLLESITLRALPLGAEIVLKPAQIEAVVYVTGQPGVLAAVDNVGRLVLPANADRIRINIIHPTVSDLPASAPNEIEPVGTARLFVEQVPGFWHEMTSGDRPSDSSFPYMEPFDDAPRAQVTLPPEDKFHNPSGAILTGLEGIRIDLQNSSSEYYDLNWNYKLELVDFAHLTTPIHQVDILHHPEPSTLLAVSSAFENATIAIPSDKKVQALRLTIETEDRDNQNILLLGNIEFAFAAVGTSVSDTWTFKPSVDDLVFYHPCNDTPFAARIDRLTNKLILPHPSPIFEDCNALDQPSAKNRLEVVIFVPASKPNGEVHLSGCLPVYDDADRTFTTGHGGCHDTRTGVTWSRPAPENLSWHQSIWGGNPASDIDDLGKLNDYEEGIVPEVGDSDAARNYCHDLVEGGYLDWRMPTYNELDRILGDDLGGKYLPFNTRELWFWSSTSLGGYNAHLTSIKKVNTYNIHYSYFDKTKAPSDDAPVATICVRKDRKDIHNCLKPADGGSRFVTELGGCRDKSASGLVWGLPAISSMPGSVANACRCEQKSEGGFTDWRMPTADELKNIRGADGAAKYFDADPNYYYSTSTQPLLPYLYFAKYQLTSAGGEPLDDAPAQVMCVRAPSETSASETGSCASATPGAP